MKSLPLRIGLPIITAPKIHTTRIPTLTKMAYSDSLASGITSIFLPDTNVTKHQM